MKPKFTAEVPATHLPPELASQFPGGRPVPGTRYRVTVEDLDDGAKLASLRADLQAGLDQAAAGLTVNGRDVLAALREKYAEQTD